VTEVLIYGTGGMAREAAAWSGGTDPAPTVLGFLDDDTSKHGRTIAGLPVLGGIERLHDGQPVEVVVAVGGPGARARLVERLDAAGAQLMTLVHPAATLGSRTVVEEGAIVAPGVVITCDVRIGRCAIVNYGAMIGHDGVVGAGCFVAPGAHIAGNVTLGDRADIGIGASIIQGVHVGADAVVGAGAVVIRDVEPGATVVGVPARPIGDGR
jgi:sugar O-acyltransferase (sialic acid O-acetyltransferase NeuD family)